MNKRGNATTKQPIFRVGVLAAVLLTACFIAVVWAQQPSSWSEFMDRGHVYLQRGQHAQAIDDFTQAIKLLDPHDDPNLESLYGVRAIAHRENGSPKLALRDINEAIRLQAGEYQKYEESRVRDSLLRGEAQEYMLRAQIHIELKNYEKAVADLDRMIELQPRSHLAHWLRGEVHRALEKHREAVSDYDRALEIQPDHAVSLAGRANAFYELEEYRAAIGDLNKVIATSPYAGAYYGRGLCFHALGEKRKAQRDLAKARELDPSYNRKSYE